MLRLRRLCGPAGGGVCSRVKLSAAAAGHTKQFSRFRSCFRRFATAESSADNAEAGGKKAKLTINGQEFVVTLYDTPAANALYEMLPLELTFADFNGIEKIAYMEDELPTAGEPAAFDPDVGDLCLYAPWGNLSLFYKDFRNSNGLVSLGRLDAGIEVIGGIQEDFSAVLERAESSYSS